MNHENTMQKQKAAFTAADLRRAIRVANSEGFERVEFEMTVEGGFKIACERRSRTEPLTEGFGGLE